MNFVARRIVEILSPINRSVGSSGDMEWARSAGDDVRLAKLGFARTERDDGSGNGGDESAGGQHHQRVESIAKQAGGQAVRNGEFALEYGAKCGDPLPVGSRRIGLDSGAQEFVSARRIENVVGPRQRAEAWESGYSDQGSIWHGWERVMIRIPALTEFLRDAKTILCPFQISDRQNRAVNLLQNTSENSPLPCAVFRGAVRVISM